MKKLRVGIIGCGRISRFHGMPAKAQPNVDLCAVCDLIPSRAEAMAKLFAGDRKASAVMCYTDYVEMIQKSKLDVVHICLPHYLHAPVAIEAMKLGCDVLTEKPMAITMKQAEEMVKAAKKYKRRLGVIFQNRYNAGTQLIRQCLDSGRLGKVLAAKCNVTWYRDDAYYTESDWKGTWDKEGGGAIIDQAIHTLDLMCWFCGYDIDSIDCTMANRAHQGVIEVEDCADGLITFKSGIRASFWAMNYYNHDADVEIELSCEKGKAVMKAESAVITLLDGRTFSAAPDPRQTFNFGGLLLGGQPLQGDCGFLRLPGRGQGASHHRRGSAGHGPQDGHGRLRVRPEPQGGPLLAVVPPGCLPGRIPHHPPGGFPLGAEPCPPPPPLPQPPFLPT